MARVEVEIKEVEDIEDEGGRERTGIRATCSRCDHVTESYGTGPKSRVRCLMLLKDECPYGEENFYVDGKSGDDRPADPVVRPWWERPQSER